MRLLPLGLVSALALSPATSFAQDDDDIPVEKKKTEETEESEDKAETPATKAAEEKKVAEPAVTATEQTSFKIKRGFFAEGDLGVFVTLGGVNTNNPETPPRSTSNIQPYVGATFGYDIFSTDTFAFGLGVRLALGLNGGAGRADPADPERNSYSNDYTIQETGAAINLVFLVADRLGLTLKLHGGAGFVTPDPTLPASEPAAGKFVFAPVFGAQLGVELYTLLNDFSIGLQVGFLGAIPAGEFIPALSGTIPIKYTF
jgi:hypothetical protein